MTTDYEKIIQDLQKQYNTLGPYYLSRFYAANGDKNLNEFLLDCYRPEYSDNTRIIVVQDCEDTYDYADLPGKAICALQKYASQIDISNFFLLVVSNNAKLAQELETVRQLYSTDACAMQSIIVADMDYKTPTPKIRDTFCVLPWMHLYVGTDGNVLPCCQADHQFPLGNITEEKIDDIIKSPKANQLRKDLLEGRQRKECKKCYEQEDANLASSRIDHNSRWSRIKKEQVSSDGTIQNWQPFYFDIRLNNICNLKCRMCSGYFSSAIAQEDSDLFDTSVAVESALKPKQRKENLLEISRYLPFAEKIYFAGGEPLLTAEHYDILNRLVDCGNIDLEIFYNTNFTTLIYKNYNVLDLWQRFKNITIGASLDAQGAVAEYVRHGSNWSIIQSNLELLKSRCRHVKFLVTSAVGLLNAASLIDLQHDWHQSEKLNISKFSMTVLTSPDHLTLSALPTSHKTRMEQKITDHIKWCHSVGAIRLANQWNAVLNYMWSKDNSHAMIEFKRLTQILDQHRHESLAATIPELANLL